MIQWPARCHICQQTIEEWADAGFYDRDWVHKACFLGNEESAKSGAGLAALRSPVDRAKLLELPMLIFVLMFHFGLGAAVAGWIMITQGGEHTGLIILIIGIIVPAIGIAGVAVNVLGRRHIEQIEQSLKLQGGWKPGR